MAWFGGAAFVGSLAYCAWSYAVTWGRPRASGFSPAALTADVLLFLAFAAHHSVTAREPVKRRMAAWVGEAHIRTTFVWLASILLVLLCVLWRPIGGVIYRQSGAWRLVHAAIQLAGVWLVFVSVRAIDPLELAGIRRESDAELQTRGAYAWVRHPLYLGWMLIVFGAATMTTDRLAFAIVTSAYLVIAVPWEERSLRRAFGDAYDRYARRVKWRVIPYVY